MFLKEPRGEIEGHTYRQPVAPFFLPFLNPFSIWMVLIRSFWSYGQKILRYGVIIFWPSPNESPLNIRVSSSPVSLRLRPHSSVLRWSLPLDFKVSSLCWIVLFFFFFIWNGSGLQRRNTQTQWGTSRTRSSSLNISIG